MLCSERKVIQKYRQKRQRKMIMKRRRRRLRQTEILQKAQATVAAEYEKPAAWPEFVDKFL